MSSPEPPKRHVTNKQSFVIEGNTSLGAFKCSYEATKSDTIEWGAKDREIIRYVIPANEFGCGNFMLNKDFKKTINAHEYKYTYIEISGLRKKGNVLLCDLKLQLAGKEKQYRDLELTSGEQNLSGSVFVNFSDFDLKAPKKMGGLFKVKEKIKLTIMLQLL